MIFKRRPWGWWIVLLQGKHFKVKLLFFAKGKSCSRQRHMHRNEMWLFLHGEGELDNRGVQDAARVMKKGDWEDVPQHAWHKYTAKKDTFVLEIQYGKKCDERDIIRK